jgi:hypothetical protein
MLPKYPMPTSSLVIGPRLGHLLGSRRDCPAVCPICHEPRTERSRRHPARCEHRYGRVRTRMAPDGTRIQGIPPGLSRPHTGQPAKSPICLIVHAIDPKRRPRELPVRGQPMISRYCARFGGRSAAGHGRRCRPNRTVADIAKSGCRVASGLCSDCSSSCPAGKSGRSKDQHR